jgi:ABC-type lipoprotein export system ATPase subunit
MEIQITVKILGVNETGKLDEPTLDDIVDFIKTLNTIEGVTVTVE